MRLRAAALAAGVSLIGGVLSFGVGVAQQGTTKPRTPPAAATAPKSGPAAADKGGEKNGPVTVDADSLESIQKEGLSVFKGNVVATQNHSVQYADRMEVYTDAKTDRIDRVVSTGNVRIITRDCRMGTANRSEYYDAEQRVVLIGTARVWRDADVVTGERITIYLAEDRSVVEGGKQERVKAIFHPQSGPRPEIKMGPSGPICP